jgi:hypothetical protein
VPINDENYICITDIARYKDPDRTDYFIQNWFRNRNTIEFLGIWGRLNNPDFNPIEFDGFKKTVRVSWQISMVGVPFPVVVSRQKIVILNYYHLTGQ